MKASKKRGFTIIELVIVIAVVAILAAVLIPTFSNVIQKAKEANDTIMVKTMNTALVNDSNLNGGKKHTTMSDALTAAKSAGYDVTKIRNTANNNEILWDSVSDCFVYMKNGEITYIPDSKDSAADTSKKWNYYKIVDTAAEVAASDYSTYMASTTENGAIVAKAGFDAGENTAITSVTYTNTASAQNVIIRTNGGKLTVNGNEDIVKHYGNVDDVIIEKIGKNSYHEYGNVNYLTVKYGHVKVEEGAEISVMKIAPETEDDVSVEASAGIGIIVSITEAGKTVAESVKENTGAASMFYAKSDAFGDTSIVKNTSLQKDVYIILDKDVSSDGLAISNQKRAILDLNGKTLTIKQIDIRYNSQLEILDSVGTGNIKFENSINGIYIDDSQLVLNGGTLYAAENFSGSEKNSGNVVNVIYSGTFIMNGGKIMSNTSYSYGATGVSVRSGSKFIMNGGEIEKTNGGVAAVSGSGTTSGTVIEINGGTIKSNSLAVYQPQGGTLKVGGGHIEGETAVYIKCGTVELNGGTFVATAATASDYKYAGSGAYLTGDAVVIDACGYPSKNPVVSINGGIYNVSASGAHGIAHYKYNGNAATITNNSNTEIYEKAVAASEN